MLSLMSLQVALLAQAAAFSLLSVIGSPLAVAGAAMVLTQLIKANTELSGRWKLSGVNVLIVAVLAGVAWLMGLQWMVGETWRESVIAVINVIGTSLMSSGLWALLLQGKDDESETLSVNPPSVSPVWMLVLVSVVTLMIGGCVSPATVGEQQVILRKKALAERQVEIVKAWPLPWTSEQCEAVIDKFEAEARWSQQLSVWSRGGAVLTLPSE